jgi:hypothetical protein
MPLSEDQNGLPRHLREYYAVPETLLSDYERACARDLLAQGELTVSHTMIGPVYTLDPVACLPDPWSVKGGDTVTDAASLAALRLQLEALGGKIERYQIKGQARLAAPGERVGVPTAMTMWVPGTLFGLTHVRVPCLALATISRNGISRRRATELLKTHPLLHDGDYHVIIGTLNPKRLGRLEQHRGPYDQRAHVQLLPFQGEHAL